MRLGTIVALGASMAAPTGAQESVMRGPLAARIDSVAARMFGLNGSPGVGIVVVRDTQIIYAKGLGFADVEAQRPFTAETEFYIASATKSFTGLAVAMLDERGAIKLDAPISRYLPGMRLRAPMNPDSITVRSLLTHTHGVGDGPVGVLLAYTGEYDGDAALIQKLAEHAPNPQGRAYSYTNLGYNIVGLAMDTVLRESWKTTLQKQIFAPLGMTRTSASVTGHPAHRLAAPYRAGPTGFARAPFGKNDATMQSAGGIITTPLDMGRWLEANMNGGRLDGRQLLSATAVGEAHKALVPVTGRSSPWVRSVGYGLGWQIGLLGSDTLISHGGGFLGYSTHMSFLPQRRVGVAVMANDGQLGAPLAEATAYAIYDVLLGKPMISADSVASLGTMFAKARESIAADRARRALRPQTLPLPLTAYAGTFFDPVWGHIELSVVNGKLEARMGAAWSAVEVFDNTKNQLRVELFGNGMVVNVQVKDDRAEAIVLNGVTFRRL